jgi:hypothetical protein
LPMKQQLKKRRRKKRKSLGKRSKEQHSLTTFTLQEILMAIKNTLLTIHKTIKQSLTNEWMNRMSFYSLDFKK